MSADNTLLALHGVHSGYGDIPILHEIDIAVAPSTLTAIVGRNGAGKTTLLRVITGLNKLTAGAISFAGQDIGELPAYVRAACGIAYVQEGKRVFRELTVEENLRLGAHGLRLKRAELHARQAEAYDRFPVLGKRRKAEAAGLSGGQQQMLAIAQALMSKPRLLLLDEPSAGLAPNLVAQVFETIESLRAEDMTIVLVEQAVDYALGVADIAYVLDLGRIVLQGHPAQPGFRRSVEDTYFARLPTEPASVATDTVPPGHPEDEESR
jgi:branched-chain amino acid transport system ATP-binding protein